MRKYSKWLTRFSVLIVVIHAVIIIATGVVTSSFLLTIALCILAAQLAAIPVRRYRWNPNLLLLIGVLAFSVIGIETYLRFGDGRYQTYSERNGNPFYTSSFRIHNWWANQYRPLNKPNSSHEDRKPEFSYTYHYNNLGCRNVDDITAEKSDDEYRILALGDSFTEGVGAPDNSTWVHLLHLGLKDKYPGKKITIINAGRNGNDPVYNQYFLEKNHSKLSVDMVLLASNSSDIFDIVRRGGQGRMRASGRQNLRLGPWWEPAYAASFIVRHIVHDFLNYSRTLVHENEMDDQFTKAANELFDTLMEIYDFTREKDMQFELIIHPHYYEMVNRRLDDGFQQFSNRIHQDGRIPTIFLPVCYESAMQSTGHDIADYFWPVDRHHNSMGYQLFANCVLSELEINPGRSARKTHLP